MRMLLHVKIPHKEFNAAVREDVSSCLALIESLEEAFGKTVEGIDEDFHEFCSIL